jgi:DNA polymerase III epsilon subunit-like protein
MIASMDCETTGLDPSYNEIIQFAGVILKDNLEIDKQIMPFRVYVKPQYPERIHPKAMEVNGLKLDELMSKGIDKKVFVDLFVEWAKKFPPKIYPLGQNWPFDKEFLRHTIGFDVFNELIDYHYRDTCVAAEYINDREYFQNGKIRFKKTRLGELCKELNVPLPKPHDALSDCLACAEVYRKMVQMFPGM